MKFFGILVFALAILVGMSQAQSPTTASPTSTYTTPSSPSSPSTTTYTYTTSPTSPTSPTAISTTPATTAKPFKQQFLSLLFNKKSG
ncbi:uncharacterized protein Dwil_GK23158 [Drosophila willistoni]|uniref:Uncharacterized protein n=1 Tax=Drosophila willistoni TaxID=7260 RepID=B4NMJ0_DROWI|nr:protein PRY2 [Drosophila willistoni]EDW85579.1 uncharacterized protein Dwil_GK23158 [Drosophila willistoni]